MTDDDKLKADATKALLQSEENSKQIATLAANTERQIGSLASTVKDFVASVDTKLYNLSKDIRAVDKGSAPNFATMASWASVIIAAVAMLCAGCFYHFNTRFALIDQSRRETFDQMNTRIERMENLHDAQVQADLERYKNMLNEKLTKD